MDQTAAIIGVIFAFSIVQSVFGIGLLVFGTPTLLLLGLPFPTALSWLLPASLAISAIQVTGCLDHARAAWARGHLLICLVPLVAGLAVVLLFDLHANIDIAIGTTMLLISAIRLNVSLQKHLVRFIAHAEKPYLAVMGVLHGFTNMGGALLSVYASTIHREKLEIRGTVATFYLAFGIVQITTIALLKPEALGARSLLSALIAAVVYFFVGRVIYRRASGIVYDKAMTGFIAIYGVAVLVKASL